MKKLRQMMENYIFNTHQIFAIFFHFQIEIEASTTLPLSTVYLRPFLISQMLRLPKWTSQKNTYASTGYTTFGEYSTCKSCTFNGTTAKRLLWNVMQCMQLWMFSKNQYFKQKSVSNSDRQLLSNAHFAKTFCFLLRMPQKCMWKCTTQTRCAQN